jgi:hypothetical protein
MSKLEDTSQLFERHLFGNVTMGKAVLAINAASAATVRTTNAITFTNNGILLTKAILAAQALAVRSGGTPFYVQPISTTVYYVLALDAAGTVVTIQGDFAGRIPPGSVAVSDGSVPNTPEDLTPFGLIKVVTNGATTFTPATTALDAAGLTVTFYDISITPAGRP